MAGLKKEVFSLLTDGSHDISDHFCFIGIAAVLKIVANNLFYPGGLLALIWLPIAVNENPMTLTRFPITTR